MRKRLYTTAFISALIFAACAAKSATLNYNLTLHAKDKAQAYELVQATENVMKRRLASLNAKGAAVALLTTDTKGTLEIAIPGGQATEQIEEMIERPYVLEFKRQTTEVPGKPEQDVWEATGLNGSHLSWTRAIGNSSTGVISIELQFTPEGQTLLEKVFKENQGKNLGIFVYDVLISSIKVSGAAKETILISGIPSATIASIVVDDMNVGLFVTIEKP